jgi:hypothetical protein
VFKIENGEEKYPYGQKNRTGVAGCKVEMAKIV